MNEQFDNLKEVYDSIKAPDSLIKSVDSIFEEEEKKSKKTKFLYSMLKYVAAFVVVSVASLNLFPKAAYAASEIKGLAPIVNVVTLNRFTDKQEFYDIDVETPKIYGLTDKKFEEELNSRLAGESNELIDTFYKDLGIYKEETGTDELKQSVVHRYEIITDTDDYLVVDISTFISSASSMTTHKFYNIDKKTQSIVSLDNLFIDGSNYVDVISDYISKEMERREKEEGAFFFENDDEIEDVAFTKIEKDQNFYINKDGNIVIAFEKYEIAPGSEGNPEFEIPNKIIKDILK